MNVRYFLKLVGFLDTSGISLWSTASLRHYLRTTEQTQQNLQPLGVLFHIYRADSHFSGHKTLIFLAATLRGWKQKYMRELTAKVSGLSLSLLSSKPILRRSNVRVWGTGLAMFLPKKKKITAVTRGNSYRRCHLQCQHKKSSPSPLPDGFSISHGLSTVLGWPQYTSPKNSEELFYLI